MGGAAGRRRRISSTASARLSPVALRSCCSGSSRPSSTRVMGAACPIRTATGRCGATKDSRPSSWSTAIFCTTAALSCPRPPVPAVFRRGVSPFMAGRPPAARSGAPATGRSYGGRSRRLFTRSISGMGRRPACTRRTATGAPTLMPGICPRPGFRAPNGIGRPQPRAISITPTPAAPPRAPVAVRSAGGGRKATCYSVFTRAASGPAYSYGCLIARPIGTRVGATGPPSSAATTTAATRPGTRSSTARFSGMSSTWAAATPGSGRGASTGATIMGTATAPRRHLARSTGASIRILSSRATAAERRAPAGRRRVSGPAPGGLGTGSPSAATSAVFRRPTT